MAGPAYRAAMPVGATFEVAGVVKGQPVKATAVRLGEYDFEVIPRTPSHEDKELQEVAGLLNRMVHYVAFRHAIEEASTALQGLEGFQKECWQREREKEFAAFSGGKTKKSHSSPAAPSSSHGKRLKAKASRKPSTQQSSDMAPPSSGRRGERHRGRANKDNKQTNCNPEAARLDDTLFLQPYLSLHRSHPQKGFEALPGLVSGNGRRPSADVSAKESNTRDTSSQFATVLTPAFLLEPGSDAFVRRLNELQALSIESARGERRHARAADSSATAAQQRPSALPIATISGDSDDDDFSNPLNVRPTFPMDVDILAGCPSPLSEALSSDKDTDESSEKGSDDESHKERAYV